METRKHMTGKLKIPRTFFFELLICMIWIQTILMQYFRAALMRLPIIGAFPDAVITICYIVVIILALPKFKLNGRDFLFVLGVTAVFIFEFLFRGQDNPYLDAYFPSFLLLTLPLYLVGIAISFYENREKLFFYLYMLSSLTIILNFIYKVIFGTPMAAVMSQYQGDMNLAYNLLPHCCLVAFYAAKKTNIFNVGLIVFSVIYLSMLGTRGAVAILLVNIAWNIIMGKNSKRMLSKILILFGAMAVFVSSSLCNSLIMWMYEFAQKLGLSIRIFDKLLGGTQLGSSGRDILTERLLASVNEHFLFGTGLCSDRMMVGIYAHNISIELWVSFGLILGTVILMVLFGVFFRGYFCSKSIIDKGFLAMLMCSSFFKLFLSGTFMDERLLFILIGACVGVLRKNKDNKVYVSIAKNCD